MTEKVDTKEDGDDDQDTSFTKQFDDAEGNGHFLTFFESNPSCQLDTPEYSAQIYWFVESDQCRPLYFQGIFSGQYYMLKGHNLSFGCSDNTCKKCDYTGLRVDQNKIGICHNFEDDRSYHLGAPDTNVWFGNDTAASGDVVLNIFYSGSKSCNFNSAYKESQLLSNHNNLGSQLLESQDCRQQENWEISINNFTKKVMQECGGKQCLECGCRGMKEKACFGCDQDFFVFCKFFFVSLFK